MTAISPTAPPAGAPHSHPVRAGTGADPRAGLEAGRTSTPRVAVTGVALACGLGDDPAQVWAAVVAGGDGIRPITRLDTSTLTCQFAAELRSTPVGTERAVGLARAVADAALDNARLATGDVDPYRVGIGLGTSVGGLEQGETWHRQLLADGPEAAQRGRLISYPLYTSADALAHRYGFRGPKVVMSNACAAGANAIGWAADQIRLGRADVMLAGGVDVLDILSLSGFDSLKALDPTPCAPLSRSGGLNLGEGCAFLVLESAEGARRRGATPLGWVRGYGLTSDAHHATAPDPRGDGALRAMRRALAEGGLSPADIGYLNAHGTGTPANDTAEPQAVRDLFGDDIPPVSSTKSQIGHTLGAAGAVEAAVSVLALQKQMLPPTIRVDPEHVRLPDVVPDRGRPHAMSAVLSNSFAFGGNNCSLLFGSAAGDGTPTARRRVVVTGAGTVSGLGLGRDALWSSLAQGRGAVGDLGPAYAASRSRFGVEVGRAHLKHVDPSYRRRVDQIGALVLAVTRMAVTDAGVSARSVGPERLGMTFGTFTGPLETVAALSTTIIEQGPHMVSPRLFPNSVVNAAVGHACLALQAKGPLSTLATGTVAGLQAVQYAADLLADGEADVIVAIAADELTPELHLGYDRLGLLASAPSAPYSTDADGLVPGAGAGALVLEEYEHARARGATILAEVTGHASTSDAGRIAQIDPEGRAWARCHRDALDRAHLTGGQLTAVYGDARGTAVLDRAELASLADAVPVEVPLANLHGHTGHLGASTPLLAATAALATLATGWVPGLAGTGAASTADGRSTAGVTVSDVAATNGAPTDGHARHALVTAAGWGGTYADLVLSSAPAQG